MNSIPSSSKTEEARIHEAYKNRHGEQRYSWFSSGHLFLIQEREREIIRLLRKKGIDSFDHLQILEVGCGEGYWIRQFINWGARPENINGVDLLPLRVDEARRLCPDGVRVECGSATNLKYPDQTFDLIHQSTVFSSVLDWDMKKAIASEMQRVLKADGLILWYDFHMDNPKNPDVQGVKKAEIFQLFPEYRVELRRITLAPPVARIMAKYSLFTCYLLERLKVINTHYLGVIQRKDVDGGKSD